MMKLFLLFIPFFFAFGQVKKDSLLNSVKKSGFYKSPESLFFNAPETTILKNKDSIKIEKLKVKKKHNKIYFTESKNTYFAYSNGEKVFINANKYKKKSNYFIEASRWNRFYLFEEQFVNFYPTGFINYGMDAWGIFGNGLAIGTTLNIKNTYCFFDIKKEDFLCLDKKIIRSRIRKYSKELIKKFRKTNKTIQDLIIVLDEINKTDSLAIKEIVN